MTRLSQKHKFSRDMQIVRAILSSPFSSRKELAKKLDLPVSTLQRRLKHLQESGLLAYQLALSPDNNFFPTRAMISFNVGSAELNSDFYHYHSQPEFVRFLKSEAKHRPEFAAAMKDVIIERVEVVLGGPTDLIILLSAVSPTALAEFLTIVIRKLPGVKDTKTSTLVTYNPD
jgi:DNA-binding Lrp family transcriptional regulator